MQLTKDYLEAREAAMTWLSHDAKRRDYDTGVDILIKSGFKPTVAKKLKSHGHQPWTVEKLHYCLREMIQMYYAPDDERFADVPDADILNHEDPSSLTSDKSKTLIEQVRDKKKFDEMPRVIQLLIRTFADSYKQRAILHRQMSDIPGKRLTTRVLLFLMLMRWRQYLIPIRMNLKKTSRLKKMIK